MISLLVGAVLAAAPPGQPLTGPGSSEALYPLVAVSEHGVGVHKYWLYEPVGMAEAPVVLYLHGYGPGSPSQYEPLLAHLAQRGASVIFPKYGNVLAVWDYESNAADALVDGLAMLSSPGHVPPDLDRLAFVGHSLGGILALRLANQTGLPDPAAVILHDGAGAQTPAYPFMRLNDLSDISPNVLFLGIVAETSTTDANATDVLRAAWLNTPQIPRDRKNLIVVPTDTYGNPDLISDHLAIHGGIGSALNAVDWYGYWMPTDGALSEAWFGIDGAYALGDGPLVRQMGVWSDGVDVLEKAVAADIGL